jgi:SAM-dependent methyltransferase
MIERARARLPEADLRVGAIENLPWDDDSVDVVAGFNSFQFAAERLDGFREAGRVARRGGLVAVCVWGPREHNDLQRLFDVVRALDPAAEDEAQEDPAPAFGRHGVLEGLAGEAGLTVLANRRDRRALRDGGRDRARWRARVRSGPHRDRGLGRIARV